MIVGKRALPFRYPPGVTIGKEHTCCIGGRGTSANECYVPAGMELLLSSPVNKYKTIEFNHGRIIERIMVTGNKTWEIGDLNTSVYPFLVRYIDPTSEFTPSLVTIKEGVKKIWEMYGLNSVKDGLFMNEIMLDALIREVASESRGVSQLTTLADLIEEFQRKSMPVINFFVNETGHCCPVTEQEYAETMLPGGLDVSSMVPFLEENMYNILANRASPGIIDGMLEEYFRPTFGQAYQPDLLTKKSRSGVLNSRALYNLQTPQAENGLYSFPESVDHLVKMDRWQWVDWNGLTNPTFFDLAMFAAGGIFTDFQIRYILPHRGNPEPPCARTSYLVNRYDQGEFIVGGHAAKQQYEFQTSLPGYVMRWLETLRFNFPPEYIKAVTLTKTWDDEFFVELETQDNRCYGYYVDLVLACACTANLSNLDVGQYYPTY